MKGAFGGISKEKVCKKCKKSYVGTASSKYCLMCR